MSATLNLDLTNDWPIWPAPELAVLLHLKTRTFLVFLAHLIPLLGIVRPRAYLSINHLLSNSPFYRQLLYLQYVEVPFR